MRFKRKEESLFDAGEILEEYLKFNLNIAGLDVPLFEKQTKENKLTTLSILRWKDVSIGSLRYYCGSKRSLLETCVRNHLLIVSINRENYK